MAESEATPASSEANGNPFSEWKQAARSEALR